ncbi:MAG: hypothetical protein AAFY08_14105 [Planctomycetota bacterium]
MASDSQYAVFRAVYDEERERYSELISRGKIYLTICSFFVGGLAFAFSDIFGAASSGAVALAMLAIFFFVVAFLLIIMALGVYEYERPFDPEEVIKEYERAVTAPNDASFLTSRIVDTAVATNHNATINDWRARLLQYASLLMFVGVLAGAGAVAGAIYSPPPVEPPAAGVVSAPVYREVT